MCPHAYCRLSSSLTHLWPCSTMPLPGRAVGGEPCDRRGGIGGPERALSFSGRFLVQWKYGRVNAEGGIASGRSALGDA